MKRDNFYTYKSMPNNLDKKYKDEKTAELWTRMKGRPRQTREQTTTRAKAEPNTICSLSSVPLKMRILNILTLLVTLSSAHPIPHASSWVPHRFLPLRSIGFIISSVSYSSECRIIGCALSLLSHEIVQAGNVSTISLVIWLSAMTIIRGVNSIAWAGNVDVKLLVWCDISMGLYSV